MELNKESVECLFEYQKDISLQKSFKVILEQAEKDFKKMREEILNEE